VINFIVLSVSCLVSVVFIIAYSQQKKEIALLYTELLEKTCEIDERRLELHQLRMEVTVLREESDEMMNKMRKINRDNQE
jgi:hypothetical protein